MLRKLWYSIGAFIGILIGLIILALVIGIFLSPIYLMVEYHWAAGFLFFVSWIPAGFVSIAAIAVVRGLIEIFD